MSVLSPLQKKNLQVMKSSKPPLSKKVDQSVKSHSENGYFYNNKQKNLRNTCSTQSSSNSSISQSLSSFALSQKSFSSQNSANDFSINSQINCNDLFQENIFLNYYQQQKQNQNVFNSKRISVFSSVKSLSELENISQTNAEFVSQNKYCLDDQMSNIKLSVLKSKNNNFEDKFQLKQFQEEYNQNIQNYQKNEKQTIKNQKSCYLSSNQELINNYSISDRNTQNKRSIIKIQRSKLNLVLPQQQKVNQLNCKINNKDHKNQNNLVLLEQLKEGQEVDTYKAFDSTSKQLCIIKRIKSNKYEIQAIQRDLKNQSYPFNQQNCFDNLLKLEEIQSVEQINNTIAEKNQGQDQLVYVKCQYLENQSLSDLLQYSKILNEKCIHQIFKQVYSKILSLSNSQIQLRNGISFQNILFDKDFQVVLGHRFSSESIDDDFKRIKQLSLYYSINEKTEQIQDHISKQSQIILNLGYLILKSIISPHFSIFSQSSSQKFSIKNFKQNYKSKNCCIYHDICEVAENQIKGSFIDLSKALEIQKFIKNNYSQSMIDLLCGTLKYNMKQRYSLTQLNQYFSNDQSFQNSQEKIQKLFQAVKIKRIQQQKQVLIEQAQKEIKQIKELISNLKDNKEETALEISKQILYEGIFTPNQVYQQFLS
ncbi:hypothetical protein TTHERM_00809420 (macronuclear) [Tetrahymena thermophila SB210]|uniref:Protein kinase domain-containing protein n=1 Tax=Tetrahymena thermophila (strain SB210) TaxID=312017 RepID=Q233N2_TETTS|nr:hypothetical protein TTHERM_00809420 [Tetrahymena thermophila SB210]EAR91797.1 hypothetical protein TTHERM_00809420 [Tetrahymena thermophila SB210]|eukprot:XP_001012042.1 hypothetical protein TTHERM_00809420 [Tetrahymena thermophila SB210]